MEAAVCFPTLHTFPTPPYDPWRDMYLPCLFVFTKCLAGLKPHSADDIDLTRLSPKEQELPERTVEEKKKALRIGKVSFDDYHAMWSGIATTKPVADASNPLSEVLKADSKLQATHFGLPQQELQEEIHKQLTEHNAIMYGKFDTGRTGQDLAELKSTKIQLLKQIYLPKQQGQPRFCLCICHPRRPRGTASPDPISPVKSSSHPDCLPLGPRGCV